MSSLYNFLVARLLLVAICLQTSLCNASLHDFIDGSFSDSWSLNFTVFMNDYRNTILYCVDYERNNVILSVIKKDVSTVTIRYNAQSYKESMQSLCGCDPCNEMLVNFYINSWPGVIMLGCNNRRTIVKKRIDIKNRVNHDVPSEVKRILNQRNRIYVLMLIDTVGCLHSFHFNNAPITFPTNGNIFLPNCPGRCTLGLCNNGKCRALSATGPICDCSSTACNGQYCNQRLELYSHRSSNSYRITAGASYVTCKLSWKAMAEKKYCLFELVHEHGHLTLSIYQKYLLRGSDVISEILPDDVNFIAVSIKDNDLVIKVNNKFVNVRIVVFGDVLINVGFSGKEENCNTFEGKLDFVLASPVSNQSGPKSYRKPILIISVIGVLVMIVIVAVVIAVIYLRRTNQHKEPIATENAYESNHYEEIKLRQVYSLQSADSVYSLPDDKHISYAPMLPQRNGCC